MNIESFAKTHTGKVRKKNEDCLLVDKDLKLYVVCDGMGGHSAGEVASQMTTEEVLKSIQNIKSLLVQAEKKCPNSLREEVAQVITDSINSVSQKIQNYAREHKLEKGMGTTIVMALKLNNSFLVSHVGDSRAYLLRGGEIHQITEDHTFGNFLIQQGKVTEEQVSKLPHAEYLAQAVGAMEVVVPDHTVIEVEDGDQLILCSDGLTKYADEKKITKLFLGKKGEERIEEAVSFVLESGAADNVSIINLQVSDNSDDSHIHAEEKLEQLKKLTVFKNLNYRELNHVLGISEVVTFEKEHEILRQGELGEELFIILEGKVRVVVGGKQVNELGKGICFGEVSLIDKMPRSATVQAISSIKALSIQRKDFFRLIKKEHYLGLKLLFNLAKRLGSILRLQEEEKQNLN
jgi:PPM family protein phosphatase